MIENDIAANFYIYIQWALNIDLIMVRADEDDAILSHVVNDDPIPIDKKNPFIESYFSGEMLRSSQLNLM